VLFYNDTGTFSPPIPENVQLANTVIGDGWAGHPSDATFVRVTVAGKPRSFLELRSVHLVVQGGQRDKSGKWHWRYPVLDRFDGGGILSDHGRLVVGFWIPNTGCLPLRLTARLAGDGTRGSLVRVIPFYCNE
jgi:hypothetical protein